MSAANDRREKYQEARKQRKRNREVMTLLGCMVVLVTAFALMIPAISITQDAASRESGFYQSDQQSQTMQVEATIVSDEDGKAFEDVSDVSTPAEGTDENASQDEPQAATDDEEASGEAIDATDDDIEDTGSEDANADNASGKSTSKSISSASAKAEADDEAMSSKSKMPAQKMKAELKGMGDGETLTVTVEAPEGALPKGVTMTVEEVVDENILTAVKEVGADAIKGAEEGSSKAKKSDVASGGTGESLSSAVAVNITFRNADGDEIQPAKKIRVTLNSDAMVQTAQSAGSNTSVAVVHIDDKRLAEMAGVEMLAEIDESHPVVVEDAKKVANVVDVQKVDVARNTNEVAFDAKEFSVYALVYTVDFEYNVNGQIYQFSLPGGKTINLLELINALGIIADTNTGEMKAFNSVEAFLEEVANVEFSDESLVKVAKIEGDWELESLAPFDTEESLTITMKNGDVVVIKVTDAQISKKFLTANGESYTITLEYDEEAEIPEDADLNVREILDGTEEFAGYLTDSAAELGVSSSKVTYARFFDIEIVKDGEKIEPKTPVRVTISYNKSMCIGENQTVNVVHFADSGTEIINDVSVNGEANEITYEQDSFSVTATIITTTPQSGKQYAVIVKHGDYYYAVLNDGSLMEVDYSEEGNVANVDMNYPMFWTYVQENGHWNLRETSYAASFTYQNLPSKYYYKYIDPNMENAINEEPPLRETAPRPDEVGYWDYYYQGSRGFEAFERLVDNQHNQYVNDCAISAFSNNRIVDDNNQYYIGIDENSMHITGKVTDPNQAATIYFAEVTKVNPAANLNHTVNHIDISIEGSAYLDKPLAYGTYYYKIGDNYIPLQVTETNPVTLHLEIPHTDPQMAISSEDMKHAEISAFTPQKGILSDAFYITGYSQNHGNDQSTPQIRLEGSFKVADLDPFDIPAGINQLADNWQQLADEALTDDQVAQRIANKIYYTVSIKKDVTFNWEYEYAPGQTAQLYDANYNPLSTDKSINLSKSFDYWDEGNECPPIIDPNISNEYTRANWRKGHILWDTRFGTGSGMDFKLEAFAQGTRHPAIEVTKYLRTVNGDVLYPKTDLVNSFVIYQKENATQNDWDGVKQIGVEGGRDAVSSDYSDFSGIHALSVTVGRQNGEGIAYDYDIAENGMIYVKEDENSVKQEIIDNNGNVWQYDSTCSETEYVWRENTDYTGKLHYLNGFNSCPEVVGHYGAWEDENHVSHELYNEFLEFYFYNVYKPKTYPVYFTKVDSANQSDENGLSGAKFNLYGPYTEAKSNDNEKKSLLNTEDIATDGNGLTKIGDLSAGYYYLYETIAPNDYKLLSNSIEIHVDPTQSDHHNAVIVTENNDVSNFEYVTTSNSGEPLAEPYFKFRIKNQKKPDIDIEVWKLAMDELDNSNAEKLKGAAFTLEKYSASNYQTKDSSWTEQSKSDANNTGVFTFEKLTEGYYKLVETEFPSGYVKASDDPRFRVKEIEGNLVIIPIDQAGNELTNEESTTLKVDNTSVRVGNTPGAALPNAGAPGTGAFTIFGSVLISGALVLLLRRLRRVRV